jgi:hypothetical protein
MNSTGNSTGGIRGLCTAAFSNGVGTMARSIFSAQLGSLLMLAAASISFAADKTPKATEAELKAREEVKAALTAEAGGDNEGRASRLMDAWKAAPDLAEANWHMARVHVDGQWETVAQVANHTANNSDWAKYRELREKAAGNPKAVRDLGRWCQKANWFDVARVHYAQVLASPAATDAMRVEAAKELELNQVGGAWITKDEFAKRASTAKEIEASLERWRPRLKTLQIAIDGNDFARRDKAVADLRKIDDPSVIPALESFLLDGGFSFQEEAAKLLEQFPQYEATVALVKYSVLAGGSLARSAAITALKERPKHEYVPLLLGDLISPIKSQYQINWDAKGRVSYTHALLREGTSGNLLLVSHGLAVPVMRQRKVTEDKTVRVYAPEVPKSTKTTTVVGVPAGVALDQQRTAALTRAASTEAQAQMFNTAANLSNSRALAVLEQTTSQPLPRDPVAWWNWWQGYNEYYWPRPTQYLYQSSAEAYYYGLTHYTLTTGTRGYSCFRAGTLVRSQTGSVPIESIQPGDRVLSQDQDTGELAYRVVLNTTVRPPGKMIRVTAGGEDVVTTLGHPFWVNGHGWKMAKELAAGDLLHSLGGAVKVERVAPLGNEQAYNLVVDDFNTYFVGHAGLLVHDNEFRKPTRAIVPGLMEEIAVSRTK